MSESKDNVPAGTRVVLLKEVRPFDDTIIHARGAVAIVTRTPAGEETHYGVRFADGSEGSLVRGQFDVSKSEQGLMTQGEHDKEQGVDEPKPSREYRLRTLDEILAPYSDPETWRWQIEELTSPELKALFSKRLESLADAAKQSAEEPIRLMLGPMSFEESLAAKEEAEMLIKERPRPNITRIISGGQTGADRAALDWAIANGIEHGGFCPKGRIAEDGIIPAHYRLTETDVTEYWLRTQRNVAESDATVIVTLAPELRGGSRETADHAEKLGKKHIHLSRANKFNAAVALRAFVRTFAVGVLNIGGSREGEEPGIYEFTRATLDSAFPIQ